LRHLTQALGPDENVTLQRCLPVFPTLHVMQALGAEVPLLVKVGAFPDEQQLEAVLVAAAAAGACGVAGINGLSRWGLRQCCQLAKAHVLQAALASVIVSTLAKLHMSLQEKGDGDVTCATSCGVGEHNK
jgi:hypothetical protein